AVPGHRPPAVPALLDRLALRLAQVGRRTVAEKLEPARVDGGVVAREFHRRADPVAGLERRDDNSGFRKDHGDAGANRGSRHGRAVALARLDWHLGAELEIERERWKVTATKSGESR